MSKLWYLTWRQLSALNIARLFILWYLNMDTMKHYLCNARLGHKREADRRERDRVTVNEEKQAGMGG